MSEASDIMRKQSAENDRKRDEGQKTPENIDRYDNIVYGPCGDMNLLDVYMMKGTKDQRMPVIIIVHGGGWVYGSKEVYQFYGMGLAQRGFKVINFTYRLAPEVKFPAPLEDTNNVVKWMFGSANRFGFDTEHVFMVGDSAGGNILGCYCAYCTDADYASRFSFLPVPGFAPKAVGMNCGAYNPVRGPKFEKNRDDELMGDYLPEGGSEEEERLVNVTGLVSHRFPPAFIMTAYGDDVVTPKQADILTEAYERAGVPYERKIYGDEKTPLYHVFHVTMQEPLAAQCNEDECRFFRQFIRRRTAFKEERRRYHG